MDTDTRETFKDVLRAFEAQTRTNAAQREVNDLFADVVERLDARIDALAAAVRALAADPGEVADAILKVVRDDAS